MTVSWTSTSTFIGTTAESASCGRSRWCPRWRSRSASAGRSGRSARAARRRAGLVISGVGLSWPRSRTAICRTGSGQSPFPTVRSRMRGTATGSDDGKGKDPQRRGAFATDAGFVPQARIVRRGGTDRKTPAGTDGGGLTRQTRGEQNDDRSLAMEKRTIPSKARANRRNPALSEPYCYRNLAGLADMDPSPDQGLTRFIP